MNPAPSPTRSTVSDAGYVLDTNIVIERGSKPPDSRVVRWLDSVPRDRLFLTPPVYEELKVGLNLFDTGNPNRRVA